MYKCSMCFSKRGICKITNLTDFTTTLPGKRLPLTASLLTTLLPYCRPSRQGVAAAPASAEPSAAAADRWLYHVRSRSMPKPRIALRCRPHAKTARGCSTPQPVLPVFLPATQPSSASECPRRRGPSMGVTTFRVGLRVRCRSVSEVPSLAA